MDQSKYLTLEEQAASYFEEHPGVDFFYATEDGMFFQDQDFAVNHNRKLNAPDPNEKNTSPGTKKVHKFRRKA